MIGRKAQTASRLETDAGLIDSQTLCELVSLQVGAVNRAIDAGVLPRPLYINSRVRRWRLSDVIASLDKLRAADSRGG